MHIGKLQIKKPKNIASKLNLEKKHNSLYRFIMGVIDYGKSVSEHHIPAYASKASFFMVISLVPFIMLLFSLLKVVLPMGRNVLTQMSINFLPQQLQDFAKKIIDELFSGVSVPVISITAILLLWAASKGVRGIITGLKNIYGRSRSNEYISTVLFSLMYTLIFIVMLIITSVVMVFGKRLNDWLISPFPFAHNIISYLLSFRSVFVLFVLTLFFMLSYRFLARNPLKFKRHFIGAFFAATGWMLFSFGFSIYVDHFSNFSYVYGSLTAIILLMFWLYACMMMFLLGAELNMWIYVKKYRPLNALRRILHMKIKPKKYKMKDGKKIRGKGKAVNTAEKSDYENAQTKKIR